MKTKLITKLLVACAATVLTTSSAFAQTGPTPRDPSAGALEQSESRPGTVMDDPAGAATDGRNWGWVGLLGLAGLFGLKRQSEVHDANYNRARTNP